MPLTPSPPPWESGKTQGYTEVSGSGHLCLGAPIRWDSQGKQTLSPQQVNNLGRGRLPQTVSQSGSSPEPTVTHVTEVTVALSPQGWKQPHQRVLMG